ncbi:MAG: hypothetical protein HKM05_04010 [Spirochaetales bacterium]|nr:hypothetical protein [Spirochaetales bacterium]
MASRFQKVLTNILRSGIQTTLEAEDEIRLLFINSIILVGFLALMVFALRDFFAGDHVYSLVTASLAFIVACLFFFIRWTKLVQVGLWFLPFLMAAFYGYLAASGGAGTSGALWSFSYPLVAIFLLGYRRGGLFTIGYVVFLGIVLFVPQLTPAWNMELDFKIRTIGTYVVISIFVVEFEYIRLQAQREIERGRKELAKTTDALLAEKSQTDGILHNIREGIFLVDEHLRIVGRHSDSLTQILDLDDETSWDFSTYFDGKLPEKEVQSLRDYLMMFFQSQVRPELLQTINPLETIKITTPRGRLKTLAFTFAAIKLEGRRFILASVRDDTLTAELNQKLKEEEDKAARQMRHLFQIIHVRPELLVQFLEDATDEIADINRRLKANSLQAQDDLMEAFYQGVHAVKGNAALIGLTSFSERVHDLENLVKDWRGKSPDWREILTLTIELSKIQAELEEIQALIQRMSTFQKEMANNTEPQDLVVMTVERAVQRLTAETGVQATLDLKDFVTDNLPSGHRKLVKDILVQFIRNSFVHGLEPAEERQARQKPLTGKIKIICQDRGPFLSISYQDDGRGLDPGRLRQTAIKKSLKNWDTRPDHEILALIFENGFSTAAEVSVHAGRGVGLGLVKTRVEASGGKVSVRSASGQGIAFDIELPKG